MVRVGVCQGPGAAGKSAPPEAVLFEELPVVEAASLHPQTLEEAPANVTVISEEEIRKYGYLTLGEALASVRGFYVNNDRSYQYVGVRGFSLPGDYNTRFLVMLNGHPLTENIYGSNNFFGQDFGLDMDLVKRIEIIRGPSSALYGSNGMFATINIVTRSPVEQDGMRTSTEAGSFGEKKVHVLSSLNLGHGANLLIAGSLFHNGGQDLYFPELDRPETNGGWARGVDGERGYHSFANLVWRDWNVTAYFNYREKHVPTGAFQAVFNDRGNKIRDSRDFLEAVWTRDVRASGKLRWRLYYDQYRYFGRYDYDTGREDGLVDNRDWGLGDWIGSQLSYRWNAGRLGALTVGTEFNADARNLQRNSDVSPEYHEHLSVSSPDRSYAFFAQHELELGRRWKATLGLRFDDSVNHRHFVSPRVALVYQPSPKTAFKVLSGMAFRNPNAFEMFYDDHGLSQIPNPALKPEDIRTVEVSVERKIRPRLAVVATAYRYDLSDLIEVVNDANELIQYRNERRHWSNGAEFELNGRLRRGAEVASSFAWQKTVGEGDHAVPPNSPAKLAKARVLIPVARDRLRVSGAFQYVAARKTMAEAWVPPVYLTDLTISTRRLHPSFDLLLGVRNLWNRRSYDPVGLEQPFDRIARDGRHVWVKLVWRNRE